MPFSIGIDIGSKTIKTAVLDDAGTLVFSAYRAHQGRIRPALERLIEEVAEVCGDEAVTLALTGSGATGLADAAGVPFVQEVVADRRAIDALHPQADAFIELGGEDAKLVYLTSPVEHRMNTSCAGGTGSFIEDVATLLPSLTPNR